MTSLNAVALISGGKDSFFSILHCQANGHKVVALANLHPPEQENGAVDDLESYMYQTVGHAVIPLYEQAIGLPLFRQAIDGTAVNQAKSYGPSSTSLSSIEDETESLLPLLRKVMAAHPEVNAVSTGAILSDYQRTRVESVALRLGLTPLSYLWHWPSLPPCSQTSLLEDMAAVGQDSRIVKVASGGLDDGFLWSNVADRKTISRLSKAAQRFGSADDGAVLGEGGEYETLAVSGPAPLWKGRIVVPEEGLRTVTGEAGSFSLQIAKPTVVFDVTLNEGSETNLRIPPLLNARFEAIGENRSSNDQDLAGRPVKTSPTTHAIANSSIDDKVSQAGNAVILANLVGEGETAADQTRSIMEQMTQLLREKDHCPNEVAYTIIVLRDMADFAAVNAVYGSYFKEPNPPARVTIACAQVLPPASLLTVSFTSTAGPRQGLHVQSRSYWAPANIGPYSQAVGIPPNADTKFPSGSVFIAGQIPLVPASMSLPDQPGLSSREMFRHQSILALQHLDRIGAVMKVKQWTFGIAFVASSALGDVEPSVKAQIAQETWEAYHRPPAVEENSSDETEDFDVWHVKHGGGNWQKSEVSEDESLVERSVNPPTLVIIEVDQLPRASAIEWVGSGMSVAGHKDPHLFHLQALLNTFGGRILSATSPT
jgi:diphthine-ammonia ligase